MHIIEIQMRNIIEIQIMNVNEKIKIGRYNKLKIGETLFIKFTLKWEYKNSFDKNQIF